MPLYGFDYLNATETVLIIKGKLVVLLQYEIV